MVGHNVPVKHINNTGYIKMPALAYHVPILNIHLPQLVRACNDAVIGYFTGNGIGSFTLRSQQLKLFAEPVDFLFVNDQLVFPPQKNGQLTVTKGRVRAKHEAS
ncbi:hypothetical protein D3C81_1802800 [compost metagenome]